MIGLNITTVYKTQYSCTTMHFSSLKYKHIYLFKKEEMFGIDIKNKNAQRKRIG